MENNHLLISVRPKYAEKIFSGHKKVELRRVQPKHLTSGAIVLLYVSSPVKSLAGAFRVSRIVKEPVKKLWKSVQAIAGITKDEFFTYYNGIPYGVGIFFNEYILFQNPIGLDELKIKIDKFYPPQGFRYARINKLEQEVIERNEWLVNKPNLDICT